MSNQTKRIAVVGGGTGIFSVLSGLKDYPVELSAIVSMADDGGSTGILREEFGTLPPGDIRRALIALSDSGKLLCDLFNYRFAKGGLKGHNFGNLLITALSEMEGDFVKAVKAAGKILNIRGKVIPVTLAKTRLCAKMENDQIVVGETNIDIPKHNGRLKIKKVFLKPPCQATDAAGRALLRADLIVIGPGDLYTSILPNLLVKGISRSIRESPAKKIYVCNLMTKFGETDDFRALDFLQALEKYLGKNVLDYIFLNNKRPGAARIEKYEKEKAAFVEYKREDFEGRNIRVIEKNFLRSKGFIRHDPGKLAKEVFKILIAET